MSSFTFIHAADLHLDSPLLGLASKSADYAVRIEEASREAFRNLIDLCLSEKARFLLLAGDVFDGHLRNFQTGLYFVDGLRRLAEAGISTYMVLGNHDAANQFTSKLKFADKVHLFPKNSPATFTIDDIAVAIHGQSFPRADVCEDLARTYPGAMPALFNIGVLHTACEGSEGHHARYAPCTPEQLRNHGYDYWALGHVHDHIILNQHPHIVYSGNLQGRHPREVGPKGAVVVRVEDGRISACEHRALDVVRWAVGSVDAAGLDDMADLIDALRTEISTHAEAADGRPLALRLILQGETPLHDQLCQEVMTLRQDVETLLATLPHDIWLEKLRVTTQPPAKAQLLDPSIAGQLHRELGELAAQPDIADLLEEKLVEIRNKLPAAAHADDFIAQMRADIPNRALILARSLVSESGHETH